MVYISDVEFEALRKLAELQFRPLKDQVTFLIHEGLIRYGMITWTPTEAGQLSLNPPDPNDP